ncbi:MAG: stage II sporulation protein M [Limnochordia bacterium]|jgi:stage II sporulation protein M
MIREHVQRRIVTYFFVGTIFFMGLVFGGLAVANLPPEQRLDLSNYLSTLWPTFSQEYPGARDALARRAIMDNVVKTVGVMWLLGLSILGAPLIMFVIFLRGFTIGFTVGFLLQGQWWQGIILTIASVLPHNIIILPAILMAGAAAIGFSWSTIRVLAGKRNINIYQQLLSTTTLTCVAAAMLVGAAFVEAYITPVLIDFAHNYLL